MNAFVQFIGSRYSDSPTERMQAHTHAFYELNFMTSGKTEMEINGKIVEYNSYDFILIPPYIPHVLNYSEFGKFVNYVIWFKPNNENKEVFSKSDIIKLHDYNGVVGVLCSEIYKTYMQTRMEELELISYYLEAVIYHMKKGVRINIEDKDKNLNPYEKIIRYINQNAINEKLEISSLAEKMNCSPTHFAREFKKHFGITPLKYIITLKMNEGKRLLVETSFTIKEIASQLGFEDQLYFSKQFSNIVGKSPNSYRKEHKIENPYLPTIGKISIS